jgi:hypothetical protein
VIAFLFGEPTRKLFLSRWTKAARMFADVANSPAAFFSSAPISDFLIA